MTPRSIALFVILFSSLLGGCCSTGEGRKGSSADTSVAASSPPNDGRDRSTVMKPNFIALTATVESVVVIDTLRYRLIVRITSATSNEGMEVPTAGERLELTPQFLLTGDSTVDLASARNTRLSSFRHAGRGKTFSGTILQNREHQWILIDAGKE